MRESRRLSTRSFQTSDSVCRCVSNKNNGVSISTAATDVVVHECRALEHNSGVVGKGSLVDIGAVVLDVSTIVHHPVLVVDVLDAPEPVPCLFGILGVGFVSRVSCKSGADVEEASIGNGCTSLLAVSDGGELTWTYCSCSCSRRLKRESAISDLRCMSRRDVKGWPEWSRRLERGRATEAGRRVGWEI